MADRTHAGREQRFAARGRRLAQARVVLRTLLRLTDRGGWVAPGVLGCAYPRTDRALAALSGGGVRPLVNLHERPQDPDRLGRHGLREVHLPAKDFAAPAPRQVERGAVGYPRSPTLGLGSLRRQEGRDRFPQLVAH